MKLHRGPCGLHCIKVNHLGVEIEGQVILEDINLHIHCGKLNVIIGKNGAGKSTLVKAILNEIPYTGSIEFKAEENGNLQKMKIGYVPQKVNIDRDSPVSVYDMIASYHSRFPVFLHKKKSEYRRIQEHLKAFEAQELIDKQVGKLSGGELQRVLLTMAVMDYPNLLVMDEPVAGIDQNGMELFYRTIERLKKEYDMAIILISHDLEYVERYADEVILLDSKILARGSVKEVYESREFRQIFGIRGKETCPKADGAGEPGAEQADQWEEQEQEGQEDRPEKREEQEEQADQREEQEKEGKPCR